MFTTLEQVKDDVQQSRASVRHTKIPRDWGRGWVQYEIWVEYPIPGDPSGGWTRWGANEIGLRVGVNPNLVYDELKKLVALDTDKLA